MKKYILVLFVFLVTIISDIQAQNQIWSLPPNYYQFGNSIQALPQPGGVFGYDGSPAKYSHNAMQDVDGNLLFFIVDGDIYRSDGVEIATPLDRGSDRNLGTEISIFPDPSSCKKFYIFYTSANIIGSSVKPRYALLDFSSPTAPFITDSGLMSNLMPTVNIDWFSETLKNGYLTTASSLLNKNNQRFVYFQLNSLVVVFKVDNKGISPVGSFDIGFFTFNNSSAPIRASNSKGEMELVSLNPSTNRLAFNFRFTFNSQPSPIQSFSGIYYTDIDKLTGMPVSGTSNTFFYPNDNNATNSNKTFIHGIEFSPNAKYLYITHDKTTTSPSSIDIYEIGVGLIPASNTNIPPLEAEDFENSEIELGKDGKLYFAGNNSVGTNNRLATYTNPNNPTTNGVWDNSAVSINYAFIQQTNHPSSKTYLLPDQIDGMDYTASFFENVACCIENTVYDVENIKNNEEQSGIQKWTPGATDNPFASTNGTVTVKDKLVIKKGAKITINNMRFEFAPNAQLIIENGALLTINDTVLTVNESCGIDKMWQGVEIWGVPGFQPALGGKLIARNSRIEHAIEATVNSKHTLDGNGKPITGSFDSAFNGGIIEMLNSKLLNNVTDVVFEPYTASVPNGTIINDRSKFINCEFITDAPLKDPAFNNNVLNHVKMDGVNGISFVGSDFNNATALNNPFTYTQRPIGINATSSKFSVNSRCTIGTGNCTATNTDPSRFINLSRGVLAIGSPSKTVKIYNSEFTDNWRSIVLRSMESAEVVNNTFDIGESLPGTPTPGTISQGLYLDNCDDYRVDSNTFNTSHNGHLGVGVENSGTGANEIYKNTFNDLTIGSQALLVNGDGSAGINATGLEFKCNEYYNTKDYDIFVSSGLIKAFHGSCANQLTPSNNRFSYTAQLGDIWLDGSVTSNVSYQYSSGGSNLEPRTGYFNEANPSVNPTLCSSLPVFNAIKSCRDRVPKGRLESQLQLNIVEKTIEREPSNVTEQEPSNIFKYVLGIIVAIGLLLLIRTNGSR